jgi:hypothetical protein
LVIMILNVIDNPWGVDNMQFFKAFELIKNCLYR